MGYLKGKAEEVRLKDVLSFLARRNRTKVLQVICGDGFGTVLGGSMSPSISVSVGLS